MPNHALLHQWWWSNVGPNIEGPITIRAVANLTDAIPLRTEDRVVFGRYNGVISNSGWNYAVLRFIIKYCDVDPIIRARLEECANPKTGNYASWRRDEFSDLEITIRRVENAEG